ncbi:MAG: M3 family metallopeptidase [Bacteroidaceae bacterium]|nr:M3 family metallopeptidase [Bacteroidaceae bacterium]
MTLINKKMNPFFTTYEYIPFDKIAETDYEPAMMKGIEEEDKEIEAIVSNPAAPTFENTVEALEQTGKLLGNVTEVFFNLLSAETTDFLDKLAQKMSPILSEHSNNITLNEGLFKRVKAVYEDHAADDFARLNTEQKMLLTNCYEGFVRNGANLPDNKKEQLRKISAELGVLSLQFSQNKLKDTNDFLLHITDKTALEGLPESAIDLARQTAKEKQMDGYVFTLQAPSYTPFLTYSTRRDLRQQMYMAYNTMCTHDNENNNVQIVSQIVNLHREMAQLLGFNTYADYALARRMAEKSEFVYQLLNDLITAYKPTALQEVQAVADLYYQQEGLDESTLPPGDDRRFQPWDFSYYANKLKEKRFNINSEMLRPYLEISKVKEGVFGLATRLYGITFRKNPHVPVYHPDVEAYDVIDKDGTYLALFYCDFHPRSSKKSGAWMTSFKEQWIEKDGTNSRPQVSIVMNLSKATDEKPALLTLGEVETFLHEFGHSLHGIFANSTYRSLSGTNVYWDFVELPSQFMENYAIEKDFLSTFACHYQTGEPLPQELIDRITASRNFNVAYACMRQVSFGLLDMAYYTLTDTFNTDLYQFENEAWKRAQILPHVKGTCMTVQFSHIMAGGYSAGYYSYKWAEVLDADAFSLFKERGIFDTATAQSFRDNILSRGGTEHPMTLYKRFRGQAPTIGALLHRNGITTS